jgi:hypothetical protein
VEHPEIGSATGAAMGLNPAALGPRLTSVQGCSGERPPSKRTVKPRSARSWGGGLPRAGVPVQVEGFAHRGPARNSRSILPSVVTADLSTTQRYTLHAPRTFGARRCDHDARHPPRGRRSRRNHLAEPDPNPCPSASGWAHSGHTRSPRNASGPVGTPTRPSSVEQRGIEPLTFALPARRSPS